MDALLTKRYYPLPEIEFMPVSLFTKNYDWQERTMFLDKYKVVISIAQFLDLFSRAMVMTGIGVEEGVSVLPEKRLTWLPGKLPVYLCVCLASGDTGW